MNGSLLLLRDWGAAERCAPRCLRALGFLALPFSLSIAASATDGEVRELTDLLVRRSESLHSFSGHYHLSQANANGNSLEEQTMYRFQADNRYVRRQSNWFVASTGSQSPTSDLEFGLLNGTVSSLMRHQDPNIAPDGQVAVLPSWPIPETAYLKPEWLVGNYTRIPLAGRLDDGLSVAWESGPNRVLTSVILERGQRLDLYVDASDRLVRIVSGAIPRDSDLNSACDPTSAAFRDDFLTLRDIEISEYETIGGMDFPTQAAMTSYKADGSWSVMQQIVLDPENVVLNGDLSDDHFRVGFPPGALVVDKVIDTSFTVGKMKGESLGKIA